MNLMGDYNIEYIYKKERQTLDTIRLPFELHITNIEFPTRVQGSSMSSIDYIITNIPQLEKFQTAVPDTLHRTLHGKEIDRYATSLMTTKILQQRSRGLMRKFIDKTNYNV